MASTIKLKESDVVKYSPSERLLFNLLPKDGKTINTEELTKQFYRKRGQTIPVNGRVTVTGTLAKLGQKAVLNREPFKIRRTKRSGPNPIEAWVEY